MMGNQAFLVLAYMAIWAGLAAYVACLASRQKTISRRVETLAERVGERKG